MTRQKLIAGNWKMYTSAVSAKELALEPAACVYLGDDLRDIQAARAAGMRSVAVGWGYGADLPTWQADAVIGQPPELVALL